MFSCFLALTLFAVNAPQPASAHSEAQIIATAAVYESGAIDKQSVDHINGYHLPPDLDRKARNRGTLNFASQLFAWIWSFFILGVMLRAKVAVRFRDWAERLSRNQGVQAFIFVPLFAFTIVILQLPLAIFDEWVLKLYRISVQTWPSWLADWAMNQIVIVLVATALAFVLYSLIRKSSRRWWFYSWAIFLPFIFFFVFLSPVVIDPLLNRYEPLSSKAPQLIPRLQEISARAGQEIQAQRMFWMLASDKTIATNASVNGIGSSERIVIWDTSLAQESTDEILADFGHEMGHYVLHHPLKLLAFDCALLLALLFWVHRCVGWVLKRGGERWAIRGLDDWASLPALLLVLIVFGFAATVAQNTFIRVQEKHADIYSLEVTHGILPDPGQTLAHLFQRFGESVLMDPDPNPVQVFFFYQHPPVSDRIRLFITYDPRTIGAKPLFIR